MANMFDENGNYNKTEWKPGDRITAGKLNKIEESLEAINNNDIERHKEADERLDALEEQNEAVEERFDELEDLVADNKSEVDTAIYEVHSKMDRLEQEMNDGIDTVEAIAHTVDDKIAEADASMKAQVAEVEADLEGLHAKDVELNTQLEQKVNAKNLYINIKEFGAKGDGVTDDSEIIQNAINTLNNNETSAWNKNIIGGTIFFPRGTYVIKKPLILKSCIKIQGESNYSTRISYEGAESDYIFKTVDTAIAKFASHIIIDSIYISNIVENFGNAVGVASTKAKVGGILLANTVNSEIRNVKICNVLKNGIDFNMVYDTVVDNVVIMGCGKDSTALNIFSTTPSDVSNALHFSNIRLEHNDRQIMIQDGTRDSQFVNCKFENNAEYEGNGIYLNGCVNIIFSNCDFTHHGKDDTYSYIKCQSGEAHPNAGIGFNNCTFVCALSEVNKLSCIENLSSNMVNVCGSSFIRLKKPFVGKAFNISGNSIILFDNITVTSSILNANFLSPTEDNTSPYITLDTTNIFINNYLNSYNEVSINVGNKNIINSNIINSVTGKKSYINIIGTDNKIKDNSVDVISYNDAYKSSSVNMILGRVAGVPADASEKNRGLLVLSEGGVYNDAILVSVRKPDGSYTYKKITLTDV